MTRKDYIAIAAAIRAAQTRINLSTSAWMTSDIKREQLRGVRRAAAHIADELQKDNPKGFDPSLFLINCGYGATTMNPRDPALDLRDPALDLRALPGAPMVEGSDA